MNARKQPIRGLRQRNDRFCAHLTENTKPTAQAQKLSGLFVIGIVMSSTAKAFNRKDGSGKIVCIRTELLLQPRLAVFEEYPDLKDGKVKLDGDKAVEFPELPDFQHWIDGSVAMIMSILTYS